MQRFSVLLILLLTFAPASAQTLGFGLGFTSDLLLEPELTLSDVEIGESKLSLRLAGGVSGPLEFGISARETQSFGPLGNLTFYSEGAFKDAGFKVDLGAEGVIATVAGTANLSLSTVQPGSLNASELYSATPHSFLGDGKENALKAQLGLSASYRLNRSIILNAEPNISYVDTVSKEGAGASLKTNVRFVRFVDRDDAYIYLNAQVAPLEGDYAALGVGYDLNRRNLPNLQGSLWLGLSADGVLPGMGLELSQTFRELGARYSLNLNAEPFRADVLPYRAGLSYTQTFGQNSVQLEAYGTLENTFDAAAFVTKLSYLRDF